MNRMNFEIQLKISQVEGKPTKKLVEIFYIICKRYVKRYTNDLNISDSYREELEMVTLEDSFKFIDKFLYYGKANPYSFFSQVISSCALKLIYPIIKHQSKVESMSYESSQSANQYYSI